MTEPTAGPEDAFTAPQENGNIVVLWRSGQANFMRFNGAAARAVGRQGSIGHLRLVDGSPLAADVESAGEFADAVVAAASSLAKTTDLVVVEIGQAHATPTWRNRSALALLRLAKAGAATVMIADCDSERSLAAAVDRVKKLLIAAPSLPLHRTSVILDRATAENEGQARCASMELEQMFVTSRYLVGKPASGERRSPNQPEVVERGTTMQNAVYEILSLMRLPCLSVSDDAFEWLLGEDGCGFGG